MKTVFQFNWRRFFTSEELKSPNWHQFDNRIKRLTLLAVIRPLIFRSPMQIGRRQRDKKNATIAQNTACKTSHCTKHTSYPMLCVSVPSGCPHTLRTLSTFFFVCGWQAAACLENRYFVYGQRSHLFFDVRVKIVAFYCETVVCFQAHVETLVSLYGSSF